METRSKISLVAFATTLFTNFRLHHALSPPIFPPAQRLTADEFRTLYPTGSLDDLPIVITDAMSVQDCEALCDQWIQAVGDEVITVQRKRRNGAEPATTQLYDCTVGQSLDLMMQSTPQDSIFAFVEGLLEDLDSILTNWFRPEKVCFQKQQQHQLIQPIGLISFPNRQTDRLRHCRRGRSDFDIASRSF